MFSRYNAADLYHPKERTVAGGAYGDGAVFKLTPHGLFNTTWTESVLYSFNGPNDGEAPYAGVIFGFNGSLLGTTVSGGTSDYGTVFELYPPGRGQATWTETTLHSFGGSPGDGSYAYGGVIIGLGGALYGATFAGGNGPNDGGTVFTVVQ